MTLFIVLELSLFIVSLLAVARVWRASTFDGVLTLVVPFYVFFAMAKYWNDPDHNIRWHVLIMTVGGIFFFWSQQRLVHQLAEQELAAVREHAAQIARDDVDADGDDSADDDDGDEATGPSTAAPGRAGVGTGSAARPAPSAMAARKPDAGARAIETHVQPARVASASRPAPVGPAPTLRDALAAATFQRGRLDRAASGFAIELPSHFHALVAPDARRIEASLGHAPDPREVAWVAHESLPLDDPRSWHVTVRWLNDGWAAAPVATVDAEQLLRAAQRGDATSRRIAGSGGTLIGYAVAPTLDADIVDWVEERVPAGATASVLDCHALRPGRKGVIEFSVVGIAPGSQTLCDATVRLLARSAHFDPGLEYSPDPPRRASERAPYALADLLADTSN